MSPFDLTLKSHSDRFTDMNTNSTPATVRSTVLLGHRIRRYAEEGQIEGIEVTTSMDPFMGGVAHVTAPMDAWEDLYTEALVNRAAYHEGTQEFRLAGSVLDLVDRVRNAYALEV